MGEAKRRKAQDPNYGKYVPDFKITKSEITNNWLIMIDWHCFDSMLLLSDAQEAIQWLRKEHKINPLKKWSSMESVLKWYTTSPRATNYPVTVAECFHLDRQTGELTKTRKADYPEDWVGERNKANGWAV